MIINTKKELLEIEENGILTLRTIGPPNHHIQITNCRVVSGRYVRGTTKHGEVGVYLAADYLFVLQLSARCGPGIVFDGEGKSTGKLVWWSSYWYADYVAGEGVAEDEKEKEKENSTN